MMVFVVPMPSAAAMVERQDDRREAQDEIGEPHDQLLDPAARIGGDAAQERADRRRDEHDDDAGRERDAGAVKEAGQHVAAECVGAEPMRDGGRLQAHRHVDGVGVIGREQRRQDRDQDPHQDDAAAGGGEAVAPAPALAAAAHRRDRERGRMAVDERRHRTTRGSSRA
jgi:hypothetical protein